MTEEREKAFRKKMEAFPSHFDLNIKLGFTSVNRSNIIKKLSNEMETTGFELEAEWTRAFNVLSFLHWRSGDYKQARMYSEKALSKKQDDIMALANQAWMHMKRSEVFETQCRLEKLEQLKDRRELIVISKAEQAFAYTRLGPRYYKKAIELFQDVIASATEFKLEETYINLWKFGLGLSLKRQLHFVNVFSFDHLSTPVDSFKYAISVLLDVAQNANSPRYQARGWVALGELANSIDNHEMLSYQDKKGLPKEFTHKTPDEFFETALSIFHDDVFVLERYGRHARYSRNYDKSIQLLRRSVEIRGTSLGHHHLAKAIRSALNKELGDKMKRSRDLCNTFDRQIFCTPVRKGYDAGYKKFLENQKTRRNLFPECKQNMEGLDEDKILGNSSLFENSPISISSTHSSTAPEPASRDSIQNDSGIFSLETKDDLSEKLEFLKMSDSTPSSFLESMENTELQRRASNTVSDDDQARAVEHRQASNTVSDADQARAVEQQQASNTFSYGDQARAVEHRQASDTFSYGDQARATEHRQASNTCIYGDQARAIEHRQASNTNSDDDQARAVEHRQASNTFSNGDQARVVEKDMMISSQRYNPSSVGGQKRQEHPAYRRCDSENSFSDRGYRGMRACHRGRTRGAQGSRFGTRRGRGHILGRSQSSDQLFPRSKYSQNIASTSEEKISRQISSPGGQYTLENQYFMSQQRKVVMPIGSPQKVLRYPPNDKRVEEILHHLEKSLKYAPSNCAARYDKGLLFRSLDRLQDAIELFIEIKNQKDCSPWQAVLCIEQHALCLQEIAETENAPDQREALKTNMKELLFEAIEKAAYIASLVPFYQPRGTAFPSLKEMLLRQDKGKNYHKTTLKEFARLYELIGKHGHALSFYKKISEMSEKDSKDPEIILKMAQNYARQKDFRNSLLFFNLIETSCTRLADDNRKLYFEAYLEGALYALEEDNVIEAKSRFKRTVRFCSQRKMISEDDEEEESSYDIHIQTSRDAENSGLKLFDLLTKTCGLKVSLNDNQTTEELKYEGIYEGIGDIMEQSCLIILIIDDASLRKGDLRHFINMAVDLNVDSNLGTGIISICLGKFNVPVEIKTFPAFIQPQHLDFSENKNENYQWLRDFFWKAAEQTFRQSMRNDTDKTDSD